MIRIASLAVATLLAASTAAAQTPPSAGGVRITRVTDPTMACTVMVMGALAQRSPGVAYDVGRPRTSREGEATLVTWSRIRVDGQRARIAAVCRAEPGRITSVTLDGAETLAEPQPF